MRRAAIALILVVASGCSGAPPAGPPVLRLGVDVCDGCGMTIADGRYAAAVVGDVDGERRVMKFDDIGCLARWETRTTGFVPRERWVHDRASEAWIDGGTAVFGRSGAWTTPMGSGLAAFAEASGPAAGTETMSWERVLELARRGDLDVPLPSAFGEEQ